MVPRPAPRAVDGGPRVIHGPLEQTLHLADVVMGGQWFVSLATTLAACWSCGGALPPAP